MFIAKTNFQIWQIPDYLREYFFITINGIREKKRINFIVCLFLLKINW